MQNYGMQKNRIGIASVTLHEKRNRIACCHILLYHLYTRKSFNTNI